MQCCAVVAVKLRIAFERRIRDGYGFDRELMVVARRFERRISGGHGFDRELMVVARHVLKLGLYFLCRFDSDRLLK